MIPSTVPDDVEKRTFEFRNGDNVLFSYSGPEAQPSNNPDLSLSSKKKKKKKKKKSTAAGSCKQFSLGDATINDPDAEYPESRVIKFDADGNVVVESLDDETSPNHTHAHQGQNLPKNGKSPNDFSLFHFNNEDESNFWLNLPQEEKSEIVNVDPHTIMERFQQQIKAHRNMAPNGTADVKHSDTLSNCPYCGRNSRYIEEELESTYREYLDEIVDYIQGVKADTAESMRHLDSGLQSFPSLPSATQSHPIVPEDKATLTPKHLAPKLQEAEAHLSLTKEKHAASKNRDLSKTDSNDLLSSKPFGLEDIDPDRYAELKRERIRLQEEGRLRIMFAKGLREELMERYHDPSKIPPYLLETLNFVDSASPAIEKSMEYLSSFSDVFDEAESKEKVLEASDQINVFAELMLKNDGRSFVDIVESLMRQEQDKKRIEEVEDDNPELEHYALKSPAPLDVPSHNEGYSIDSNEIDPPIFHEHDDAQYKEHDKSHHHQHDVHDGHHHAHSHGHDHRQHEHGDHDHHDENDEVDYEDEEYGSDYDDDYEYEHECEHHHNCDHDCHHECEHDDHYEDDSEQESEEELEYSRQKRIEEVRGFFMIQAVTLIRQKFRDAYEKKISEDRTQKFIEELEAEENAKKEKELKKLKQKEKQKEKKRLQQLQKEEEKKRKEAEELQKATELKRKQDELRAEQMRRKEELRLKKEEEKLKKIEALKKKELEQRKLKEEKLKLEQEQREKEQKLKEEKQKEQQRQAKERKTADLKKLENTENHKADVSATTDQFSQVKLDEQKQHVNEIAQSQTPPVILSDQGSFNHLQPAAPEAPNNHLLEQLYQAKSKTVPSNNSFTQPQQLPLGTESIYSPSIQNAFTTSQEQFAYPSWGGGSNPNLASSQPNVFSPFVEPGTTATDQWPKPQYVDAFSAPNVPHQSSTSGSSVWGGNYAPRNNSIWNSNPAPASGGSNIWSSSVPQNGNPGANILPSLAGESNHDANSIQAATYDAFCALQNSNQVTFGMASAPQLFQTTKQVLNNSTLGMAEFLSTLRTSGRYQFDFVYDDSGSVTHIKLAALSNVASPPMVPMRTSLQSSVPPQLQTPLQQQLPPQVPLVLHQPTLLTNMPFHQSAQQFHQHSFQQVQPPADKGDGFAPSDLHPGNGSADQLNYDISLPGSVQDLLTQLGFGLARGSIW